MTNPQEISPFYLQFNLVLIGLVLFGIIYALIMRKLARSGVQGQTAYTVVVGVLVTVLGASVVIGLYNTLIILSCFVASGIPMILEYVQRTHQEQQRDQEHAKNIAKDLLG